MDLSKIGKFISECRKSKKFTQEQLSQMLNVSNRAVSKWERGLCLPDASIMIELCDILEITVNELLCGEKVNNNDVEKKIEENIMGLVRQKEEKDEQLLTLEIVLGFVSVLFFIILMFIVAYVDLENYQRIFLILISLILLIISISYAIKIEQIAGYYCCRKCGNKYVPTYLSVFFAMHFGRTRYMKCPKCNKYSWNKKVIK